MIRLFVADDHAILREGLRELFALVDDITVVGEAMNGEQVLDAVRDGDFDLLLLDMNMPGINGVELLVRLRSQETRQPILVLSMHDEPQIVKRAIQAGADGYLTKDSDPDRLLAAVRKVAAGGCYIDPGVAERMALEITGKNNELIQQVLTERETAVLELLADGITSSEIGHRLHIATATVMVHRRNLMRKLDLHCVAELTKYAIRQGMIAA
ncbi:MAG: response regulator transcription factor [Sterolibacterium sp.]